MCNDPWSKGECVFVLLCLFMCLALDLKKSNNPLQVRAHPQAALKGEHMAAPCMLRACEQHPLAVKPLRSKPINDTAFRGA